MISKLIKIIVKIVPRPWMIRLSKLSILIRPLYLGNKVECPICGKHYKKFMPYGNKGLKNRMCPNCLSLERHRLLWIYLKNYSDFFTKEYDFLHFAPEQPFLKTFKNLKNLNYKTADIISPIAELRLDIMDTKLPDNSYDIVFANHVLEHVSNDIDAMKEIYRIMRPNGWAILQVPINPNYQTTDEDLTVTDPKEREKRFGQYDHLRFHGLDYPKRLQTAGFKVKEFSVKNNFSDSEIERMRLDNNEILYVAIKE